MTGFLIFFAAIGLLASLGLLLFGVWLVVAGERVDEHWSDGLDARDERDATARLGTYPLTLGQQVAAHSFLPADLEARAKAIEKPVWPAGLDEEPTLNVQNHIGDSRPLR
jgi:hypothetical protein